MRTAGLNDRCMARAAADPKSSQQPPPPLVQPWRRQTVFVAATLPVATKGSVGATIRQHYPAAEWLQGPQLHKALRQVTHAWREVGDAADAATALCEAVADGGKVLVFARDVAAADKAAAALKEAGVEVCELVNFE